MRFQSVPYLRRVEGMRHLLSKTLRWSVPIFERHLDPRMKQKLSVTFEQQFI